MNIGLDFGGVIANHHALKVPEARRMFGDRIPIRSEADVVRAVLLPKVGAEAYAELIRRIQDRTLELPLYDGVREGIARLAAVGHRVSVVTTQERISEAVIAQYLAAHELVIRDLAVVRSDAEKRAACEGFGVRAFLDDNLSVLETLRPLGIKLIFANFHDTPFPLPDGIAVVRSWGEFERFVGLRSPQVAR